jgi:O-antigen/teichoic acid export membrane protein
VVSVARQDYGNSFGTESLGIYAAVATPAVLIQAAAMYLCNPALVPLSIRWAESPTSEFPRFLAKAAGILLAGCVAMVVVLSLLGSPFLKLVYGQSIADYTWLFPWVLVSTAIIAMMQFLSDVLTICRNLKGKLISSLCAIGTDVALMIPLEQTFQMNGINLTIIIAMLVGVSAEITFLKSSVRKAEKKNQTGPVQSHQAGSQD